MKTKLILLTTFAILPVFAASAQMAAPPPPVVAPAAPAAVPALPGDGGAAAAPAQPAGVVVPPAATPVAPVAVPSAAPAPAAAAAPAAVMTPAPTSQTAPAAKNEIRMNFQGAALSDVLHYLSNAAGFIIVQQQPVTGTVNVMSAQPVTADQAVALLSTVLYAKGYVVFRDDRILNIVPRTGAEKNSLMAVKIGTGPEIIPKDDEVVTQIMPIKYLDATKVVENLRPLLSVEAIISVNESSNALVVTDTQANIHRIAEIIHALDTSISSISTIKVYPLRYADAKDFATVLTQLFSPDESTNGRNGGGGGGGLRAFFGGGGGGRGGGGGGSPFGGGGGEDAASGEQSEARKAQSRVIAVPDTQSNSVVVSAPDEYISTIDEIVTRLDTSTTDVTETRLFKLEHADCGAVSTTLNSLYGDPTSTSGAGRNGQQNRGGAAGGRGGAQAGGAQAGATSPSQRELLQARMVAVSDPRTNSVIVNCSHDTMDQVATTIHQLDATDSKKQNTYVINLQHADPDTVASILRVIYGDTTSAALTASILQQRQTTGVSTEITGSLSTSTGSTGR